MAGCWGSPVEGHLVALQCGGRWDRFQDDDGRGVGLTGAWGIDWEAGWEASSTYESFG